MKRDFANNVRASAGDAGTSIDLQGSDSVIVVGLTDPTARILVSDSAGSGFAAPPASDLITPEGGASQNAAFVLGYIGPARYLQAGAADVVVQYDLHARPPGLAIDSEA